MFHSELEMAARFTRHANSTTLRLCCWLRPNVQPLVKLYVQWSELVCALLGDLFSPIISVSSGGKRRGALIVRHCTALFYSTLAKP